MRRACALAVLGWLMAGVVAIAAERGELPQIPKAPAPSEPARIRGFSVTLVLGEMQGTATPDNLPPGAKKALDDMRSFLPYKSFRLLDTQWLLCCAAGGFADLNANVVSGRLRGLEEHEYRFGITILNVSGSQLSVRFLMNHAASTLGKKLTEGAVESGAIERPLLVERLREAQLELQHQLMRREARKVPGEAVALSRARVEQLERQVRERQPGGPGGKGAIIDSTFSMDVGETVVIGTSSLKGEKALITLLTAAPRAGSVPVK